MKKLIPFCLLFMLSGHLYAQTFSAGIIGGFANTDVTGLDIYDADIDLNRIGVVLGGFVNRSFNDRTSVQMELLYATKGTLQPADSAHNYLYYRFRLDYIEIPVLFKYKMHLIVNKASLDKLELETGPSYGQLISSSFKNNNGEYAISPPFNKSDFLFNLGFNYYFTEDFSFDLRFASSVVPIRPQDDSGSYSYYSITGEYNITINYTFRYIFR